MDIDILTCFPEMFKSFFSYSIIKIAQNLKLVNIKVHNIRDFSKDKHKKIDDYAYGGGAGLVMTIQPIYDAINILKKEKEYDDIIYMAPDGDILTQEISNELSLKKNIIILCGRYKGIDERIRKKMITREISVGKYVLSGGEIPACVLVDSIVRLIPGVLHDSCSALEDSFQNGDIVAPPVYTRPRCFKGMSVPKVLFSGDEKKIKNWRLKQSFKKTKFFLERNGKHEK